MIPALVLAAGRATRLRPLSRVRAKAALPVAGEPLVQRIIAWLAGAGVHDLVINLHHLPHTITRIVGDGAQHGVRVRYSWETLVLGSAGGPRHALSLLDAQQFLIVNGDTLTNLDLTALMAAHERSGALVTLAVVPNTEPDKYGGVTVDDGGAVTGFTRKGSEQRSFHFVGVQVAHAQAFAGLSDGIPYESIGALYPDLMRARSGCIRAHVCEASFLDIGTTADYVAASLSLARREGHMLEGENVVWDDVVIGKGARLRRCVVTDGVRVPPEADWHNLTVRRAAGELEPFERREGDVALGPIGRDGPRFENRAVPR
jgi:NDP-sugar pyrophosphorylase family protein